MTTAAFFTIFTPVPPAQPPHEEGSLLLLRDQVPTEPLPSPAPVPVASGHTVAPAPGMFSPLPRLAA